MNKIRFIVGQLFCTALIIASILATILIAEYGAVPLVIELGDMLVSAVGKHVAFALMLAVMLLILMSIGSVFAYLYMRISERVLLKVASEK